MLTVNPAANAGLRNAERPRCHDLAAEVVHQFFDCSNRIHDAEYRHSYCSVNRESYLPCVNLARYGSGMKETLQDRLRSALHEARFTQVGLAKLVGVSQPTISGLVNIEGTGSQHIAKIAHLLGVRALWLDTGEGPRYEADFFLDENEAELIELWRKYPPESQRLLMAQFRALKDSA